MARRTSPPFRADHVGSLLRPPAPHRVRADFAAGTITADQLRQAGADPGRQGSWMSRPRMLRPSSMSR
jgi:hypothetical protein